MASYQVVCITKPNPQNSTEHITHIGYHESAKKPQVIISVREAIRRIEANPYEFFVRALFDVPYVQVVKGRYLKTIPDPFKTDNLLRLPRVDERSARYFKHDNSLSYSK